MFIVDGAVDVFIGQNYHRESNMIAEGLHSGNWAPLLEGNIILDGRPLALDWYQKLWLADDNPKICEKGRRIGLTTIELLKRTIKAQFIPVENRFVSLTQKHTYEALEFIDNFYSQLPERFRSPCISNTKDTKEYLIIGDKSGAFLKSGIYGHSSSSTSIRGKRGNVTFDEFAHFPERMALSHLATVKPIMATRWRHYNDTDQRFEINLISTHWGDMSPFNQICRGEKEFDTMASHYIFPWTVSHRIAREIINVASGMDNEEYLEEMCCVPLSDKLSAIPRKLYDNILEDIEFDQNGIRVFRDEKGVVVPFDRGRYDLISVGWDYATFSAETAGWGWGFKYPNILEPIFFFRMKPEDYGGSIEEDIIAQRIDFTARILKPDYLAYDATGVGMYLSRVLFDPAYGFGKDRRPRLDKYPYAAQSEPIQCTSEWKNTQLTKLLKGYRMNIIRDEPMDTENIKQMRNFKRTLTSAGKVKYAAEGKGKVKGSNDDIVCAKMLALGPIPIEDAPPGVIVKPTIEDIIAVQFYGEMEGFNEILPELNVAFKHCA
jgi:hypothetical protein